MWGMRHRVAGLTLDVARRMGVRPQSTLVGAPYIVRSSLLMRSGPDARGLKWRSSMSIPSLHPCRGATGCPCSLRTFLLDRSGRLAGAASYRRRHHRFRRTPGSCPSCTRCLPSMPGKIRTSKPRLRPWRPQVGLASFHRPPTGDGAACRVMAVAAEAATARALLVVRHGALVSPSFTRHD